MRHSVAGSSMALRSAKRLERRRTGYGILDGMVQRSLPRATRVLALESMLRPPTAVRTTGEGSDARRAERKTPRNGQDGQSGRKTQAESQ